MYKIVINNFVIRYPTKFLFGQFFIRQIFYIETFYPTFFLYEILLYYKISLRNSLPNKISIWKFFYPKIFLCDNFLINNFFVRKFDIQYIFYTKTINLYKIRYLIKLLYGNFFIRQIFYMETFYPTNFL